MPYKVLKTKGGYGVKNTATGKWRSRGTTKSKAQAQWRLLEGVKRGWRPTGAKAKKKGRK